MNEQAVAEYNRRHAFSATTFRGWACTPPIIILSALLGCLFIPVFGGICTLVASPFIPTSTSTTTTTTITTITTTTATTTSTTTSSSSTTTTTSITTTSTTHTGSTTTTSSTSTVSSTTTSSTATTRSTTSTISSTTITTISTTSSPLAKEQAGASDRGRDDQSPAPEGADECPVFLSMTLQNVGYRQLLANPGLRAAFEAQVCGAVALEAGHGISPDHVLLDLKEGSVAIKATIVSLSSDKAAAVESQLKATTRLGPRVAQSVGAVQGIAEVSTGLITVTDISTSGPVISDAPLIPDIGSMRPLSTSFITAGGLALLAMSCIICGCCRKSKKGYALAPGDDLLPRDADLGDEELPESEPCDGAENAPAVEPTKMPASQEPRPQAQGRPKAPATEGRPKAPATEGRPKPPATEREKPSSSSPPTSARGEAGAAYAAYIRLAKDMGFPEDQASAALAETGGNSELALERLLSRP